MAAILSQGETLDQEQDDFAIVSTTFTNREGKKFPHYPIAIVRPIRSVAQTSAKDLSNKAQSYYLPSNLSSLADISLPIQPYQLKTIDEQPEELRTDDIAVSSLARSITGQNVGFVRSLASTKRGKFLSSLTHSFPSYLPKPQSKLQDLELGEEQLSWRGVFPISGSTKVLFSENIEVRVDELPAWKPNVVIDSYRLEDDDE